METDNSTDSTAVMASMVGFEEPFGGGKFKNQLQLWGNRESMNINSMVLTNIKQSPYFKHGLIDKKTFHEVVDEIYYKVTHLEPWERGSRRTSGLTGASGGGLQVRGVGAGGIVSTAYCLLYKLFSLRINRKQLQTLLDHPDSPYIRGLGFMYIRYCTDPKEYWDWFEPYMDDAEEIDVKAGGGCVITIGEMLRQFVTQLDWYGTLFPRIPVPIEKELRARLQERGAAAGSGRSARTTEEAPAAAAAAAPVEAASASGRERGRSGGDRSRSRSRSRDNRSATSSSHHRQQRQQHHRQLGDRGQDRDRGGSGVHRDRDRDREDRSHHHRHQEHRDKERDRGGRGDRGGDRRDR